VPKPVTVTYRVFENGDGFAEGAAAYYANKMAEFAKSIDIANNVNVAFSGGTTPKAIFDLLADDSKPYRALVPWERLGFFFVDERSVPPNDKESNYGMAKAALLVRPNAVLPVKVAPKVQKHFEDVRKEAVQELAAKAQPAPAADAPRAASITPPPPTSEKSANSTQGLSQVSTHRDIVRPQFLIPTIGGAALIVAGGVSWALSRQELSRLRNNDSTLLTRTNVRDTASRGSTYQSLGVGMLGVGLAGLGFAAGLYVSQTPSPLASIELSTDGASAYVQGRWK